MHVLAAQYIGAGGLGFLVILALIVAGVFLFRSMNRHLKNVPPEFEEQTAPEPDAHPDPHQDPHLST